MLVRIPPNSRLRTPHSLRAQPRRRPAVDDHRLAGDEARLRGVGEEENRLRDFFGLADAAHDVLLAEAADEPADVGGITFDVTARQTR